MPVLAQKNITDTCSLPVLNGLYFGQKPPGMIPEVFAPDIITSNYEVQNCLTITPDGKEIYWGLWDPEKK